MNRYWIKVKNELSIPFCVALVSCILVVLGALRNIVSPLGYWLFWAFVAAIGMAGIIKACREGYGTSLYRDARVVTVGFSLLLLGAIVAGSVNNDKYTLYQGCKFFCIYIIFLIIFISSRRLSAKQILTISKIAIIISFSVFVLAKYVFLDFYIVFGDGREGSLYADPGVLWRSSVFFIGFVLAGALIKGRLSAIDLAISFAAVYILFADSSRTGFLLFLIVCVGVLSKVRNYISFSISRNFLLIGALVFITMACLICFLNFAIFDRVFKVDSTRLQMLADGVSNIKECYFFGCGFSSSTSIVFDKPMVVHNAYLAALADLGVLGFTGLVIIVAAPIINYFTSTNSGDYHNENSILRFIAMIGVAGYGLSMLLHSLSSELSEWGIWIVMVSWQMSLNSSSAAISGQEAALE